MAEPASGMLHPMFTPGSDNKNAIERLYQWEGAAICWIIPPAKKRAILAKSRSIISNILIFMNTAKIEFY